MFVQSLFVVIAAINVAHAAEKCIEAKDTTYCKNFPISFPESYVKDVDFSLSFASGIAGAACPDLNRLLSDSSFRSVACVAESVNAVEKFKQCNPGKPVLMCKKSCLKALEKQKSLAKDVKCPGNTEKNEDPAEKCNELPETDCFDLDVNSASALTSSLMVLVAFALFL